MSYLSEEQISRTIFIVRLSSKTERKHLDSIFNPNRKVRKTEEICVHQYEDGTQYAFVRFKTASDVVLKPDPALILRNKEIFFEDEPYITVSMKNMPPSVFWVLLDNAPGVEAVLGPNSPPTKKAPITVATTSAIPTHRVEMIESKKGAENRSTILKRIEDNKLAIEMARDPSLRATLKANGSILNSPPMNSPSAFLLATSPTREPTPLQLKSSPVAIANSSATNGGNSAVNSLELNSPQAFPQLSSKSGKKKKGVVSPPGNNDTTKKIGQRSTPSPESDAPSELTAADIVANGTRKLAKRQASLAKSPERAIPSKVNGMSVSSKHVDSSNLNLESSSSDEGDQGSQYITQLDDLVNEWTMNDTNDDDDELGHHDNSTDDIEDGSSIMSSPMMNARKPPLAPHHYNNHNSHHNGHNGSDFQQQGHNANQILNVLTSQNPTKAMPIPIPATMGMTALSPKSPLLSSIGPHSLGGGAGSAPDYLAAHQSPGLYPSSSIWSTPLILSSTPTNSSHSSSLNAPSSGAAILPSILSLSPSSAMPMSTMTTANTTAIATTSVSSNNSDLILGMSPVTTTTTTTTTVSMTTNNMFGKPFSDWTTEQVQEWIKSKNLFADKTEMFNKWLMENDMDGEALVEAYHDLKTTAPPGISYGHWLKLTKHMKPLIAL